MVKDHRVRKDRLLEKFRHGLFVFSYQAGIHPIPLGFDVVDGEDADTRTRTSIEEREKFIGRLKSALKVGY